MYLRSVGMACLKDTTGDEEEESAPGRLGNFNAPTSSLPPDGSFPQVGTQPLETLLIPMRTMDQLPSELLHLVLEFTDHATQKACRLVNKHVSDASTPLVFSHFYMGMFQFSLRKLHNLSISRLAKHVKKFTVYSDILPHVDDFEAYCELLQYYPPPPRFIGPLSKTLQESVLEEYEKLMRVQKAYVEYQRCVDEQKHWRADREGLVFRESFAMLSNLAEARILCAAPSAEEIDDDLPVWKSLHDRTLIEPIVIWRHWVWEGYDFPVLEHDHIYTINCDAVICLLNAVVYRASFSGTKPVVRLTHESAFLTPYWEIMRRLPYYRDELAGHPQQSYKYINILTAFDCMTHITVRCPYLVLDLNNAAAIRELEHFLLRATNLRTLQLDFRGDGASTFEQIQFHDLFAGKVVQWPHLQRLSLSTDIVVNDFICFLELHSKSLTDLELFEMFANNVKQLVRAIPKVLHLQRVHLKALRDSTRPLWRAEFRPPDILSRGTDYDDPHERSVKRFLLRQETELVGDFGVR